jgi:pyruvate/2-oxoacid:ferredoxin oxidoreductase beta subunit
LIHALHRTSDVVVVDVDNKILALTGLYDAIGSA